MSRSKEPRGRVTIVDIAAALGVTPTTVSNAFNRPDQLSPALRERILATAAAMGYLGPDAAARSLRRGRLRAVGVLYADRLSNAFADAAFVLFLEGLAQAAEEADLALTLVPALPAVVGKEAGVAAAVVDGLVIYSMASDDPLVAAALARRLPLVVADSPQLPSAPTVGIDDRAAAWAAADHLLQLGHRRFGIVSGDLLLDRRSGPADLARQAAATFGVNRDRLRGYADALTAAGLDWATVPVEEVADGLERATQEAMGRLLAHRPRPTAILAMSDRMAWEVLTAAVTAGLSVPDDLSVVGFDDIPAARWATPPLTTVRQPHREKGRATGRLLIAHLEGRNAADSVVLPTELVVRDSTGPPRS
jgi:DNA-binding LacI/PurR family transcriptional regulator